MTSKDRMRQECWECIHKKAVPGNAHIGCANPDLLMTGDPHGIRRGWFFYPLVFDPVWKTKLCHNFTPLKKEIPHEGNQVCTNGQTNV